MGTELVEISRSEIRRDGMRAAELAGDQLLAEISAESWRGWWLSAFQARLRRGERDAVDLYPKLLRMVGAEDTVLELALRALGASLEFAREAVSLRQQVDGMDEAARAELCLESARKYYSAQGKRVVVLDDATDGNGTASGA